MFAYIPAKMPAITRRIVNVLTVKDNHLECCGLLDVGPGLVRGPEVGVFSEDMCERWEGGH